MIMEVQDFGTTSNLSVSSIYYSCDILLFNFSINSEIFSEVQAVMFLYLLRQRPKIHSGFIMNSYVDYQLIQSEVIDRVHIIIHLSICKVSGSTKKPPLQALHGSYNLLGQFQIIYRQEQAYVCIDF